MTLTSSSPFRVLPSSFLRGRFGPRHLVAKHTAAGLTWYHGGLAGQEVGDLILLPSQTGAASWKTTDTWTQQNKHRLHVTHYAGGAAFFARWTKCLGQEGRVYAVEPQGEQAVDPEAFRLAMLLQEDPATKALHLGFGPIRVWAFPDKSEDLFADFLH